MALTARREQRAHARPRAQVDEVDKLHFVLKVKQVPHEEGRNAELALYRRRPDEAEAILLQARAARVLARRAGRHERQQPAASCLCTVPASCRALPPPP